ncbi:hypothetical protein KSP40_PGU011484 [Platanthera guangdongensis]|uniref:Uncharacterized protein n=1 Tax=Platanthera guangdongensis TaxID=2320717 RepID=A0ABR2M7D1_9ASPA
MGHTVLSPPNSDLALVLTNSSPVDFTVNCCSSGEIFFRTDEECAVFKNRYLEILSWLPVDRANLYAISEHTRKSFRLVSGEKLTLWNANSSSMILDVNLYVSHPIYMDVGGRRLTSCCFLIATMDMIYSGSSITYKLTGGVLDFYIFAGPSPVEILDQYMELIG